MQTEDTGQVNTRPNRQRKYDTYIPPENAGRSSIVAEKSFSTETEIQVPVYVAPPVQPVVHHVQAEQPVYNTPKKLHTDFSPKFGNKKPKANKLFGSIVKATVSVDRVTRQSVQAVKHSFEPPTINSLRTKKQRLFVRSFYVIGTASFLLAVGMGFSSLLAKEAPAQKKSVLGAASQAQNDANRASEIPSEVKPNKQDIATYLVAPLYPRYIRVPSMGIEARVRRLGVDSKGAVGSPNNINDAGWYDGSVRPGEKDGSSIVIGHVAGPTQPGIFWDIIKMTPGTLIEIEKGNGETVTYKVDRLEKLPAGDIDMSLYISPQIPGKHDLKMITSSGKYDVIGDQYAGRIVVFASQL